MNITTPAIDWCLVDDFVKTKLACLAEGGVYVLETRLIYDPAEDGVGLLVRAWTNAEALAFMAIIKGDGTHAVVGGVAQDGSGGATLTLADKPEAVALARSLYPHVFRSFAINYDPLALLLADAPEPWPTMMRAGINSPKAILATQVQEERDTRLPPYILLDNRPAPFNCGLHLGSNTEGELISLGGLTDEHGTEEQRLYKGSLLNANGVPPALRKVVINAAIPMDFRIASCGLVTVVDPNGIASQIAAIWLGDLNSVLAALDYTAADKMQSSYQFHSYPKPGQNDVSGAYDSPMAALEAEMNKRAALEMKIVRSSWIEYLGPKEDVEQGDYIEEVSLGGLLYEINEHVSRIERTPATTRLYFEELQ